MLYSNLISAAGPISMSFSMGIFPWRFYFQKDAKILSERKRLFLENKIQELSQKLGIQKKLQLIEIRGLITQAQAMGNILFPGIAGIAIDPAFVEYMSEEGIEFILAHEISHIKHHDLLTFGLIYGLVSVITTIALTILFPPLAISSSIFSISPAASIGLLVGTVAWAIFSRWREEYADKRGFSICSKIAQKESAIFFKNQTIKHINYRNQKNIPLFSRIWRKIVFQPDGECRLDILHPSLKSRYDYLHALYKIS